MVKQGEQKPNPYSGTSFEYNGHVWGMCARDCGVEILIDSELKAFVSLDKTLNLNKTEPKFKVGDVMRTLEEASCGFTGGMPVVVSIDDRYYYCNNELISIKYQDNYEYPPMNRKTTWSEEDEKYLNLSLVNLTELKDRFGEKYGKVGDCIDWLKSIKKRMKGE